MLVQILTEIFERDLVKLKSEIEAYSNAADLWVIDGDIANSSGNLALHIAGNLRHFIGGVLGGSGYARDRDLEFSQNDIPRVDLVALIDETREETRSALEGMSEDQLNANYPIEVFGEPLTTGFFLVHLATHLNYHLGQVNYHRRILAKRLKGESQNEGSDLHR
jgi:uncharacterized damage-inducible protein DinB